MSTRRLATALLLFYLSTPSRSESINCLQGTCRCRQPGHCYLFCDSEPDQCKEANLVCYPGHDCTIYCLGETACGDAHIIGSHAAHVSLLCDGTDACKGSDGSFECGHGHCGLNCIGQTACEEINIYAYSAESFQCIGFCPIHAPPPFTARPTEQPTPAPVLTDRPTEHPTSPTRKPSTSPSRSPTKAPTNYPSTPPTPKPSDDPTPQPTPNPTRFPTTMEPTMPSQSPTAEPSVEPSTTSTSGNPTPAPWNSIRFPYVAAPSSSPTRDTTPSPSKGPTRYLSTTSTTSTTTSPPTQTLVCSGHEAECHCEDDAPCIIECEAKDACQNARLACPLSSECTIHCGNNGCAKATVLGPRDADFSIFCDSTAACADIEVYAHNAANVLFSCGGKDACKGSDAQINCGNGMCELLFLGESAGDSALINVNGAKGFECVGQSAACPDNFAVSEGVVSESVVSQGEEPFKALCPIGSDLIKADCVEPRVWNENECGCGCPKESVGSCAQYEIWNEKLCECQPSCPHIEREMEEYADWKQLHGEGASRTAAFAIVMAIIASLLTTN